MSLFAFGRLVTSEHPFKRWHVQPTVDLHALDLSPRRRLRAPMVMAVPPGGVASVCGV